ncbi:hypothetical protein FK216_12330 [Moraxellaceae bacterium AER2_44_116]|jgi:hypothetical protein|nr:hypothetical protein [Agitococcus sp.]TQC96245.1 hypothetical protein FK216_12330 [Moraxellaceae bacterium AER2_44_116]
MEWIAISGIVIWLGFCWMVGRDRGTSLPLVSSQVIDYSQKIAVSPLVDANVEMLSAYWDQQKKKIAEISSPEYRHLPTNIHHGPLD